MFQRYMSCRYVISDAQRKLRAFVRITQKRWALQERPGTLDIGAFDVQFELERPHKREQDGFHPAGEQRGIASARGGEQMK